MSLRWKLALGTALAVLVAAGLHLFFAYVNFSRAIEGEIQSDLVRWQQAVVDSLDLSGPAPRLKGQNWPWLFTGTALGFRVVKGGRIYLEAGFIPERPGPDWEKAERPLDKGYQLVLYLYVGEYRQALRRQLQSGLISLPFSALLAALFGFYLAHRLLRPLDTLAQGVERLTRVQFPNPLPEPRGKDELAALTRSFNRMAVSLKEAFERERAFTRYASHELRNPLATLQAQLEALEAGLVPQEEALAEAKGALRRMRSILEGLLQLAREPRARPEPLPLYAVAERVVAGLPSGQTRVRLELPRDLWVLADEALLNRLLENLLQNALKHTDGAVYLRARPGEAGVLIEVQDEGPGVNPVLLKRLTEPFFRAGQRGGMGLGLALAAQAARALGGELRLENRHPGLVAAFTLPRMEVPRG